QPTGGRLIVTGAQLSTQRSIAPGVTVSFRDGDVDHQVTVVEAGKLGSSGRLMQQVARIFGKRVVAFESSSLQADGFVMDNDDRSIFINTKTQISPLAVFGHELTHLFKRDNAAAYSALENVVQRQLGEGAMEKFRQEYGAGANLEELTSDLVGNRFQEADFWSDVFDDILRQDPSNARSIITRMAAAITKAVNAFLRLVRQPGFQADMYVKDLNNIKAAVRQAISGYAVSQRQSAMRLEAELAQAESQIDLVGGKPFAYDRDLQGAQREVGVPLIGTGERVQASRQRGYNVSNDEADNATQRNESVPTAAAQDGRGAGADGRGDIPSYGQAREGAIAVVGRHYSTQERTSLNGSYYGTGLKGAERTRLNDSSDPRLRQRVYFYVDDGAGITPEAGVGRVAHEVRLNNIYDPSTRLISPQPNINAFESAVINAGFDGYIA
ncbi:MAG: hypothetical protein EBT15_12755, partial [Betaproteobacteria bacterium]|nr:hypothetical protein [Betaproteobacteria bacterium]